MALIQISARHHDHYPTAGLNAAQVVAVYRLPVIPDGTIIALNARDPRPTERDPTVGSARLSGPPRRPSCWRT